MSKFDAAAIIKAAEALANEKPKPVNLPGIGALFKRRLNFGDIEAAEQIGEPYTVNGVLDRKTRVAIGVAQMLCGPDGEPIFDASNKDHIGLIVKIPWDVLRQVNNEDEAGNA